MSSCTKMVTLCMPCFGELNQLDGHIHFVIFGQFKICSHLDLLFLKNLYFFSSLLFIFWQQAFYAYTSTTTAIGKDKNFVGQMESAQFGEKLRQRYFASVATQMTWFSVNANFCLPFIGQASNLRPTGILKDFPKTSAEA